MPTIIVIPEAGMPAVIDNKTDEGILAALNRTELSYIPKDVRRDIEALKAWLETLAPPSGYFENADEAKAFQERVGREQDAQLVHAALEATGMSHREMTAALGLADPQQDGSPVHNITLGQSSMSGPTRRVLAFLLKYGPMSRDGEREILNGLKNGAWRHVRRSAIRRK